MRLPLYSHSLRPGIFLMVSSLPVALKDKFLYEILPSHPLNPIPSQPLPLPAPAPFPASNVPPSLWL